ncbi:MAG: hypothetical protein AABW41_04980 [Nanoarchaeota archaeon]
MKPLSEKEIEVISNIEFDEKYFFTRSYINKFFKNNQQVNDFIFGLRKKGRILRINKTKYYLIPIKARSGKWSEHTFIVTDEICNSKDYFIGGWSAAKYWKLTDQIPMQIDIYTTRRQGKYNFMNMRFIFHRTTKNKIKSAIKKEIEGHQFYIQNKETTEKWFKQIK